jgi:ribosomal protein S18 acetylase RimI-like enzyme
MNYEFSVRKAENFDKNGYAELNLMFMKEVMDENPYWRQIEPPSISEMENIFIEATNGNNNMVIFVAEVNGKIVGYINAYEFYSIWSRGKSLDIDDLYVATEYRRKKIASALMDFAVKYAENNDFKRVQLLAEPDNFNAHYLYGKLGFEIKDMKFFMKTL